MHTLWQMLEQLSSVDSRETLTGRILRAHGVPDVTPGAYGLARPDLVLLNEVSGAMALRAFAEMGAERVFDPARVALVIDHFVPAAGAPAE
jgi:3-isopropylmalate/(R)-2-methylmalate dehydratase large subunit